MKVVGEHIIIWSRQEQEFALLVMLWSCGDPCSHRVSKWRQAWRNRNAWCYPFRQLLPEWIAYYVNSDDRGLAKHRKTGLFISAAAVTDYCRKTRPALYYAPPGGGGA
jgi:hypothetical protein